MKYQTINEFEHFELNEVHISDVEVTNGFFHIVLDDVVILPENSCNRDIRKMRANDLVLKIDDMKIQRLTREGYKTYNADGKLLGQTEDTVIPESDYSGILKTFTDGSAYSVTKEGNTYTFIVDATDESTYELVITGSGDRQEWDRFLSWNE
ncbi:MAG: subtilin biosynthesis sensor protein SpaK [Agathobacter sp.]|nr:subtilin biosynthesis sensor protein SpaK [Agathobacter sp.]